MLKHSEQLPYIFFIIETCLLLKIVCAPDLFLNIINLILIFNGYIVKLYQVVPSSTLILTLLVLVTITESAAGNGYTEQGVEPAVIIIKVHPEKSRYCVTPGNECYCWDLVGMSLVAFYLTNHIDKWCNIIKWGGFTQGLLHDA